MIQKVLEQFECRTDKIFYVNLKIAINYLSEVYVQYPEAMLDFPDESDNTQFYYHRDETTKEHAQRLADEEFMRNLQLQNTNLQLEKLDKEAQYQKLAKELGLRGI